jgi:hypothetical protein
MITNGAEVHILGQAAGRLHEIISEDGRTPEQFFSDAIGLLIAVEDTRDDGGRLLFEKNGRVQELVPA